MAGLDFGVLMKWRLAADRTALHDLAQATESLGYESAWVSEHMVIPLEYKSRYPFNAAGRPKFPPDTTWAHASVALGFVAAVTDRIRLGTTVIPTLNRDPISLAKEAATLDALSGGRLELGLGSGWLREEGAILGHPTDQPAARLEETIEILRKAWSPGTFSHEGRFWTIPEAHLNPKPVQGSKLPIWIGGVGKIARRTTVDHAIGNIVSGDADKVREVSGPLRARRADLRICALLDLHHEDLEVEVANLRDAGADVLILRCTDDPGPESVRANIERLEWFAREVRAAFRDRGPNAFRPRWNRFE